MSAQPVAPHPAIDDAPISHMFKSPRDVFAQMAEKSKENPELMALAESVAVALDRYLAGEITLRDFARTHTPYERFRAVRAWGPLSPYFPAIMPVLDDLIALHRGGKTPQRPARVGADTLARNIPVAERSGRGCVCAVCGAPVFAIEGRALLCRSCAAMVAAQDE